MRIPLLPDISKGRSSYEYLQAQSCATIELFAPNLIEVMREHYGGVFSKGFDDKQLDAKLSELPEEKRPMLKSAGLIIPCLNDRAKLQFRVAGKAAFTEQAKNIGLASNESDSLWEWFKETFWNEQELLEAVAPQLPEIRVLFDLWRSTLMHQLTLSAVGIAIG